MITHKTSYLMEKTNLKRKTLSKEVRKFFFDKDKDKIVIEGLPDSEFDFGSFTKDLINFFVEENKFYNMININNTKIKEICYEWLKGNSSEMYGVFCEAKGKTGVLLGFLRIRIKMMEGEPDDAVRISTLYVSKENRKKVIATILLEFAENLAIDRKKKKLRLRVFTKNKEAVALYEKNGFKMVEN